jgi:phosphoglycerate kinase
MGELMTVLSIRDIDITGKRVLFRFDFNVPLDENGAVKDDTRIRRSLPTILYAIERGAKSILTSHLGRPKGEVRPEMSLKPVAAKLRELLGRQVAFVDDCIGPKVKEAVQALSNGGVLLLENLRFHGGETKNDPEFSMQLASIADVYVNDAFGTAHRAHSSTVGVADLVKEKAAGFLMKEELDNLTKAFANPARPVVSIFGGAKVSDKLVVLENIIEKMDSILIGGGMANTFLKAKGVEVGSSKIEEDMLGAAAEIMKTAKEKGRTILLPSDVVIAEKIEAGAATETIGLGSVPAGKMALDIGPVSVEDFRKEIAKAGTIIWNGPMGVFEIDIFSKGTMDIGQAVAESKAFSLVGGGDTIRAVRQAGVTDKISYISTGGGAFMEFMEGKVLPGIAALERD